MATREHSTASAGRQYWLFVWAKESPTFPKSSTWKFELRLFQCIRWVRVWRSEYKRENTRTHTHTAERRRNCILVEKFNVFLFHFPELSALFAWERIRQVKRRHSIWSVCMCDSRHSRSVLMCSKLYIYSWLLSIIVLAAKWRLSWKLLLLISSFSRSIFSVINSFFVSSHLASSFTFRARAAEFVRKYLV